MRNYSKQRQILKKYMGGKNWEEFEEILEENLDNFKNDKKIKWKYTPSIECCEIWNNFCRYHKNK